jgi:hypothetical protein
MQPTWTRRDAPSPPPGGPTGAGTGPRQALCPHSPRAFQDVRRDGGARSPRRDCGAEGWRPCIRTRRSTESSRMEDRRRSPQRDGPTATRGGQAARRASTDQRHPPAQGRYSPAAQECAARRGKGPHPLSQMGKITQHGLLPAKYSFNF